MTPVNTREGIGMMLVSGDPGQIAAVLPELEAMTSQVINLGAKPGVAAAFKLFGNLAIIGMMGVVGDVVRLAHAAGVAPVDAVALFRQFNPGELLASRAAKVASGPYEPPSFTADGAQGRAPRGRCEWRLRRDEKFSEGRRRVLRFSSENSAPGSGAPSNRQGAVSSCRAVPGPPTSRWLGRVRKWWNSPTEHRMRRIDRAWTRVASV